MSVYSPLIEYAIKRLHPNKEEVRQKFVERAWLILEEQLRAVQPPLSEAELAIEQTAFEEAVHKANVAYPLPSPGYVTFRFGEKEQFDKTDAEVELIPFKLFSQFNRRDLPSLTLKAILQFGDRTAEGRLVEAVTIPWFEILERFRRDPREMYQIDPHLWEEIVAGAYKRAGFDEVELTPRSGDKGRDVVATKKGWGSIRIFDQVKAYAPNHPVPANDVRALIGVMAGAQNVSKAVITTTSTFAPRVASDEFIKPFLPYRLELRDRDALLPWLMELSKK